MREPKNRKFHNFVKIAVFGVKWSAILDPEFFLYKNTKLFDSQSATRKTLVYVILYKSNNISGYRQGFSNFQQMLLYVLFLILRSTEATSASLRS